MKRFTYLLIVLISMIIPLSSYADEKQQQTTAPEASQQKEQFERRMEERLRTLGKQIDELKAKAATMTEKARKDMSRHLADAEKKQKAASEKLEEMRKKSAKKWEKFSSDVGEAVQGVEKAYEKAKSHFKE